MSENWLAKEMEAENKKRMNPMIKRAYIVLTVILLGAISVLGITLASKPQRVASASQNTPIVTGSSPSSSTSPTASIPTVSSDTGALSQEEAEDKAMAAEDEADAGKDVTNAQSALNSEAPPGTSGSLSPVSLPSISRAPPAPNCSFPSDLSSLQSQYIGAEGQL
ncbi:MAG TPA: hypothetical protein VMR75_02675, partial [Candidatus Saccharimonadales bacterium]|nr:hypothetical protein [Candidatus Saccharimonadales bacterium]